MERSLYAAIEDIRNHKRLSLYLLYGGQDHFAANWLAEELRLALLDEGGGAPVELAKFTFSNENWPACLATAYNGDLFSSRQAVLCTGFELVSSLAKAKSADAALTDAVLGLFQDPPESPIVFYSTAEKLDERKKLTKHFLSDNRSVVAAAHQIRHDDWRRIIGEWAGRDLRLSPWQTEQLEARCAGSLSMLRQEIEKLRLFAFPRDQLDDADFAKLVADASSGDLFAVVRLVLAKKPAEALAQYKKMADQESFFALLALLARQYRLVARVQLQPDASDQTIARNTGTHPYGVKVAREQARRVPLAEAEAMLARVQSLEFMVKSGQIQERSAVDWFFLKLFE